MKLTSIIISFLPLTALAVPGPSYHTPAKHHCTCLTKKEADHILLKWSNLARQNYKAAGFKSIGALINATVSENFISYEETFNNGAADVSFKGRANFMPAPAGGPPDPIKDLTFKTVYSFHDCSNIAYRWQYSATTTGQDKIVFGPGPNDNNPLNLTQVPKGSKFHYKGIDLLVIDPCTKLVKSEYTSQDWLNFLLDIGWEFCPTQKK